MADDVTSSSAVDKQYPRRVRLETSVFWAVLLLWTGLWFGSAIRLSCGLPQAERGNQTVSVSSNCHYYLSLADFLNVKVTDVLIALFTWLLATKTAGLFKETAGLRQVAKQQEVDFLRSVAAAESAAEAAKESADALQASERAVVFERLEGSINLESLFRPGENPFQSATMQVASPVAIGTTLYLKNYGKTPANILSYSVRPIIQKDIPAFDLPPPPSEVKLLINSVIEAQGETEEIPITGIVPNSWEQSIRLRDRQLEVWLAGEVMFTDVFDIVRTREFVWRYDRPMKLFVPFTSKTRIERVQGGNRSIP